MARSKTMTIFYADGRDTQVTISPRAQVMTERHFGMSLLDLKSAEQAYYMGWAALTVAGLEHGDFEDFLGRIDDVEVIKGDEVVPTGQAQPPGTSSS